MGEPGPQTPKGTSADSHPWTGRPAWEPRRLAEMPAPRSSKTERRRLPGQDSSEAAQAPTSPLGKVTAERVQGSPASSPPRAHFCLTPPGSRVTQGTAQRDTLGSPSREEAWGLQQPPRESQTQPQALLTGAQTPPGGPPTNPVNSCLQPPHQLARRPPLALRECPVGRAREPPQTVRTPCHQRHVSLGSTGELFPSQAGTLVCANS